MHISSSDSRSNNAIAIPFTLKKDTRDFTCAPNQEMANKMTSEVRKIAMKRRPPHQETNLEEPAFWNVFNDQLVDILHYTWWLTGEWGTEGVDVSVRWIGCKNECGTHLPRKTGYPEIVTEKCFVVMGLESMHLL